MQEKYGFYKVHDDSINEIIEQIKQNIRSSNINYQEDYEETLKLIKAFYAYKSFIKDYLPKIINKAINKQKSDYKYIKDINITYLNKNIFIKNITSIYFIIGAIPNKELIYNGYNIFIDENIYKEFMGYIKRMLERGKIDNNIVERRNSGESLNLGNHDYYLTHECILYILLKELIDCYYNELQALELMEEEINILIEEYQIKDSELVLKKQNT